MKNSMFKITILALYITTVGAVWSLQDIFGGFSLLVVTFFLAYCGIIVVSQLVSTLVEVCRWCVAARREETFSAPAVAFETETEAT